MYGPASRPDVVENAFELTRLAWMPSNVGFIDADDVGSQCDEVVESSVFVNRSLKSAVYVL